MFRLAVVASATLTVERQLQGVSFERARRALLEPALLEANGMGPGVRTGTTRRFYVEYTHPRGGPTIEHYEVRADGANLILDVDARSPRVPFGDRFATRLRIWLKRTDPPTLTWQCGLAWIKARPSRFIARRIEKAAEAGASTAYSNLVSFLVGAPKRKRRPLYVLLLRILTRLRTLTLTRRSLKLKL